MAQGSDKAPGTAAAAAAAAAGEGEGGRGGGGGGGGAVARAAATAGPPLRFLFALLWAVICYRYFVYSLLQAYDIRLIAIREYGHIIHEFDPWFNYRATEYLYEHGWRAFKSWYDYKVWYPLGRPVGTTIYPGMQVRV